MTLGGVALLGDSITDNTRIESLDWFGQANEATDLPLGPVYEQGVGGDTTAQMLARIGAITALDIGYCVVLGGANDAAAGTGSATTIANLEDILDALVAANITPIVGTILPRTGISDPTEQETITGTNAWLRTTMLASYPTAVLVDWNDEMNDGDELTPNAALFSDAIHPNAAGATVMAGVLDDVLATLT